MFSVFFHSYCVIILNNLVYVFLFYVSVCYVCFSKDFSVLFLRSHADVYSVSVISMYLEKNKSI